MNSTPETRVALVTGSGKGVGAGVIRYFTSRGIRCCIHCNTNGAMAEDLLREVREKGGDAFIFQGDVTDPKVRHDMVEAVIEKYGRLDILVNNAAMQPNKYIDEYDYASLKRLWEINIGGYTNMIREALPYLRKSPMGRIINMSSVHGKRPTCFDAGYAMTKGAIRMLTRELALELIKDQITVNAIDLGGCKIEFKTGHPDFHVVRAIDTFNPNMVRPKEIVPEEVGALCYYLASEEGSAVNGAGVRIDRGQMLT